MTTQKAYPLFDLVHQVVKLQLNPLGSNLRPTVVKPKTLTQAKPCPSQMSKKLDQYRAGRAPQISRTLDCNLSEMRKLSNSVEECVPINIGCLHVSSQLVVVTKALELYNDVGDIANIVAGGGGVRQSRSNTSEFEVMYRPLEGEVCS